MGSLLRKQPFKGIFLLYKLGTILLLQVPIWAIKFIPASGRPRPSWTFKRSMLVTFLRNLSITAESVGNLFTTPTYRAIQDGPGVKGVWIEPTPELISPEFASLAAIAEVEPVSIPGYWLDKEGHDTPEGEAPAPGEKVLYALHGGGYVMLSAHPGDMTSKSYVRLLNALPASKRALSLEYRLSTTDPEPRANPFPAALLDAVAGYNYLVHTVGVSPADIILAGDSAGGNLALALTRYLLEHQGLASLPPPPGALLLLSPWCDIGSTHLGPGTSERTNLASDTLRPVPATYPPYSRRAFTGPFGVGAAEFNPYISPASRKAHPSFAGFPRTFIHAGGAEQLLDSIRTLRYRMVRDNGERVTYFETQDGIHDHLMFTWHEPENTQTLKSIREWAGSL